MILSPAIIESVISAGIQGPHIVNKEVGGSPPQAILFDIIRSYYSEHRTAPDDAVLVAEVEQYLIKYFPSETRREKVREKLAAFFEFRKVIDTRSEGVARKLIGQIAKECIFRPAAREMLSGASESGDIEGLSERLLELEAKQSSVSGGLSFSGIVGLESDSAGERVPTGIPWFDSRAGKGSGPVNGSAIGIISPQNGGKTTLGIQLAVAQALMDKDSLLVLAEEGVSRSMRFKIIGCALGFDYTLLEKLSLAEAVKQAGISKEIAEKKLALLDQRLHILDMVKHNLVPEGFAPIQSELSQLISGGHKPSYVYVDWAGIIADAVSQRTKRTKEAELQSLSYAIAKEAHRVNCIIAISQQMGAEWVKKGPFSQPDMYCAADCRMFTAPFKYAIAINKQDPRTKYSIMTYVKARDDGIKDDQVVMQLRGELATFVDLSDRYEIRGKRFVDKRRPSKDGKTPSENDRPSGGA